MDFELLHQVLDDCEECKAFDTKEGCNKGCPVYNIRQALLNALSSEVLTDWTMNVNQAVPRL